MDILARHSKVVEQDDKMNKGKAGIMPNQEIQLEKGFNLLDKQEEIHIVSNNNIDIYLSFYFFFSCFNPIFSYHSLKISIAYADIRTRSEAYRQFVDPDDAQIDLLVEAITTYPHLWNACEKFSEHFQAWREKEFHKLCNEAVEIGFESSWVDDMRQHVLTRDPKSREEIAERQMDESPKRFSSMDMVDSRLVEQGDGLNENCKRNLMRPKTQNVNSTFERGIGGQTMD
ncbi:hypothetical protein ACSQ67_024026 [Phaseolus vulgaris]